MNAIYWHMNATLGGANLHPGVNLLPGANLHPGANCAHEHGFRKTFSKYYRRHHEFVSKFNVGLRFLFTSRPIGRQVCNDQKLELSEPEFNPQNQNFTVT